VGEQRPSSPLHRLALGDSLVTQYAMRYFLTPSFFDKTAIDYKGRE
jgi:hypothetical protein